MSKSLADTNQPTRLVSAIELYPAPTSKKPKEVGLITNNGQAFARLRWDSEGVVLEGRPLRGSSVADFYTERRTVFDILRQAKTEGLSVEGAVWRVLDRFGYNGDPKH